MLQRVGLAQSLINDPELVFLDEPMSGLDPIGRREIRELISELRENGTTVFMSTHILSDIEALCDEVAILRNGRLAEIGKLDELLNKDSDRRGFEISFTGIGEDALKPALAGLNAAIDFASKPNGVIVTVPDQDEIDAVLAAARGAGGKIVSVEPLKQSLEELFVDK
jgi:ABC-2 type transport system ATP-binding protein